MKAKQAIIVLLLAAGGAAYWAYPRWKGTSEVVLSGTIEARDVQVGSLLGGRITAVLVDEGATVVTSQTLVTLEPDLMDLQIQEQQARVEQARSALALAIAGPRTEEIARTRVDSENAQAEWKRFAALLEQRVISRQEYENAEAEARMKLEVLRQNENGTRPEDIEAARANLAQTESHLGYLRRQRRESIITSPANGVIQSLDLRPGNIVAPNQPVLTLLEPDQLWVRVYVPETKLGHVTVGQSAAVTVDTFPKREFPGKVVEIRERGEYTPRNIQTMDQRTDLVFGVKVSIERAHELKPGMAAFVTLKP